MFTMWPLPTPAVRDLLRRGAEVALNPRPNWLHDLHAAVFAGDRMRVLAEDPVLSEALRHNTVSNLVHWAAANVQDPGHRVAPNVGPQTLELARDLARRGLDERVLDSYRTGQSAAWRRWMEICFDLTSDPAQLRELLDFSSLSISTFLDDTIAGLTARIEAERQELDQGSHADRRAVVGLLLEGAPIHRRHAEERLGYGLTGAHTAAIVWSTTGAALEGAAETLTKITGAARRLTVIPGASVLWVWLPVAGVPRDLETALHEHPGVRVAVGRAGRDLEGFRRSHLDAVATQRMLTRLTSPRQVARYQDVHLVVLLSADPAQADEFVADTLGDLRAADQDVLDTLHTYVAEQCNTSRTAERLYTHRNTVIRRLARADELLPRPLAENVAGVAAALELLRWRG
ncbi:transcriptional regulator [Lentzea guizhouensis]|uniref:Transcriptional regulator n=2 Tax=Lentzea guizhouensis TaxID=1586287 RepID=A0A1B2HRE1_9PSEU|nr:transcriptional regulator [Lentzea guizhouensis]